MNRFIKSLSLINVLLLSITLTSCGTSKSVQPREKYESFKALSHDEKTEKMKAEIQFMCKNLEKKHKNLYHSISKEEFKEKEDELLNEVPNIKDEKEYYLALSELITTLKDAHTRVGSNNLYLKDDKYYGFNIEKFEKSWILTGIGENDQDKLGYEVRAINDVDINEIYDMALNFYPHENPYVFINDFSSYVKRAELLNKIKVLNNISDDDISLKLLDNDGKEVDIKVPSADFDSLGELVTLSSKVKPMTTDYNDSNNYWNDKLSDDVYYIQYNKCAEDNSLKMDKFTSEVSNDIKDNEFKKVIIDLRYNGGGNSKIIEPLYDELEKLKKEHSFQVYILIGGNTFSSGLLNAYDGKNQLDAILAGQPTGGNLNQYGEVKSFDLPYSGFVVDYSTKYFENVKGYDKDALYPDIESPMKLKDYINGVDTVVQAVINF